MEAQKKPTTRTFWYLLIAFWLALGVRDFVTYRATTEVVPYNQFLTLLNEGKVESVIIEGERIQGKFKDVGPDKKTQFLTLKMDDPALIPLLTRSGIRFEAIREPTFFKNLASWLLPGLFLFGLWWYFLGRMGRAQGQFMSIGKSTAKVYVERDLKTKFSDVAGVDEAKFELEEVVQFLKDPSKYGRLGGRMPKGILLVGPPGTGKTLMARAVAGEASVPFFSINGSEFVEMFVGLGAARVRDLFVQARSQAPCIIFIDELDAIGKSRGVSALAGGHDEKEQTLNQLLAELDGFDPSQGVVLLAATNRPEILDPALLRSGRFDRQVVLDKPDRKGRTEILKIHLKNLQASEEIELDQLASLTTGFSGADLANLVNEAALIATRRGATLVEQSDFTNGIERIVGGLERKSRVLSPEEKRRIAYHEMGHTAVSFALEKGEAVHKVSIIPRGIGALGHTMLRPTEERYLIDKGELESKIAVLLGGRASERIFLNGISTGAADDLDKATDIARAMVTRYGMSDALGLLTYDREVAPLLGEGLLQRSHDYSEATAERIDDEIKNLIDRGFALSTQTIEENRPFIEECVRMLLEKETLDESTLKEVWGRTRVGAAA